MHMIQWSQPLQAWMNYLYMFFSIYHIFPMPVVFTLKDIMGLRFFVSGGNKNVKTMHWMLWMLPFSHLEKNESYHSDLRGLLTLSLIWSGIWGFVGRLIIFSPMASMCLILLNMGIFTWILVLTMYFSLRAVRTSNLLNFHQCHYCIGVW